jgi:ATP-dependent DNA helicase RecQ
MTIVSNSVSDPYLKILREVFALEDFRHGQRDAIAQVIEGRDTLVVMPTGSGKSLIFQFAAVATPGTALVISPLIALMKDQVDHMLADGIAATYINSSLSTTDQARRLEQMKAGSYKLVYVAPERLRNPQFLEALQGVKISLLAIDEAHCVSQWGHDFRPDYLHIGEMAKRIGRPTLVALTATATPEVQKDIIQQLELRVPQKIITGFQRKNLVFHVKYAPDLRAKQQAIRKVLGTIRGAGIIYVGTRREAEDLAVALESEYKVPTMVYHGGMDRHQRSLIQDAFLSDPKAVLIATNAFGMGVDRPDVRFVIHFNIPGTLEAYYQEAGRAGRDGRSAQCMLLYAPQDRNLQEWFIDNDAPSRAELQAMHQFIASRVREGVSKVSGEDIYRATKVHDVKMRVGLSQLEKNGALVRLRDDTYGMHFEVSELADSALDTIMADITQRRIRKRGQLDKMVAFAETTTRCRQKMLVEHFGDQSEIDASPCCDFHLRETHGDPHPEFPKLGDFIANQRKLAGDGAERVDTITITEALFNEGLSAREVAARRGLVISTIFIHAADLIKQGRLPLRRVVSEAHEIAIRRAIVAVGSVEQLSPIKAQVHANIDFGEIRAVVAQVQNEMNKGE